MNSIYNLSCVNNINTDLNGTHVYFSQAVPAGVRFLIHRVFLLWNYLLNLWSTKCLSQLNPEKMRAWRGLGSSFREKNFQLQSALFETFLPHTHACIICKGGCCLSQPRPFFAVDELLMGGGHKEVRFVYFDFRHLLQWAVRLFRHFHQECSLKVLMTATKETSPQNSQDDREKRRYPSKCPELTETGCRLPLGDKTANCITYLCPKLALLMTWREFHYFMSAGAQYLWHLTLAIPKACRLAAANAKP